MSLDEHRFVVCELNTIELSALISTNVDYL